MTAPEPAECPIRPAPAEPCAACRTLRKALSRKAAVDAGSPFYRDTIDAELAAAIASVEANHAAFTTDPYYTCAPRPRRHKWGR